MQHTFRSRGDNATVSVTCDGHEHVVTIAIDGTVTTQHDSDADAVLFALGGDHHSCRRVENSYEAAVVLDLALRGIEDVPGVRRINNTSLRANHHCNTCRRTLQDGTEIGLGNWAHFTDPSHLAVAYQGDERLILAFSKWIARRVPDANRTSRSRMTRDLSEAIAEFSLTSGAAYHSSLARQCVITRPLLEAYSTLTRGRQDAFTGARVLRQRGVRVEWLTYLAANVTASALRRAIQAHDGSTDSFIHSLVAARNVSPITITTYLNAGITTHFHTYARHRATKEQVLAVYRASGGNRSLADYLNDGVSIPDAIADAPRHRAAA